jgi:hypothetical protein
MITKGRGKGSDVERSRQKFKSLELQYDGGKKWTVRKNR